VLCWSPGEGVPTSAATDPRTILTLIRGEFSGASVGLSGGVRRSTATRSVPLPVWWRVCRGPVSYGVVLLTWYANVIPSNRQPVSYAS